jgi:hypothetical protein
VNRKKIKAVETEICFTKDVKMRGERACFVRRVDRFGLLDLVSVSIKSCLAMSWLIKRCVLHVTDRKPVAFT